MIENYFYPVLRSSTLKGKPIGITRFGERWVAWRDNAGAAHILPAACPHRGADLAQGSVRDGHLACPWHGFQFDGTGTCRLAPCEGINAQVPANVSLNPATTREEHGLIWMWRGDQQPTNRVPWVEGLDQRTSAEADYELPYHYSRMVETNLDIFHTPFVHGSVIPGVGPEVRDFEVHTEGDVIRSSGQLCHPGRKQGMAFAADFHAPSLVHISLTPKLHIMVAQTPAGADSSWLWFRYCQDYTRIGWLGWLISWISVQSEMRVVQRQDWRIFAGMTPGPLEAAPHNLVRADLAIARYRQWRRQKLGLIPAEHPVTS